MGRPARDGQPERQRAGVGDDDVEVRRLGDHGQVAGHAGPDRREHPLAAVLLGRDERDEDLAGQARPRHPTPPRPGPPRGSRRRRPSCRRRRGRTARRRGPRPPTGRPSTCAGSPGRHDVGVADEDDPPPARLAEPADHDRQGRVRGISSPGQSGSARTVGRLGLEQLDVDAGDRRRAAAASQSATASSEPVTLGIRTSARRSSTRRAGSTAAAARPTAGVAGSALSSTSRAGSAGSGRSGRPSR